MKKIKTFKIENSLWYALKIENTQENKWKTDVNLFDWTERN